MLNENKFLKYSLYATGEIILVVLGILIAFQIDTWNTERLEKVEEIEVLEEILSNLKYDIIDMENNINSYDTVIPRFESAVNHIILKQPMNPEVSYNFTLLNNFDHNLILTSSGYETAKISGLKIISNNKVRSMMKDLYEFRYPYLQKWENGEFSKLDYDKNLKSVTSNYINVKIGDGYIYQLTNYEVLIEDKKAKLSMINALEAMKVLKGQYMTVYDKINLLIAEIEQDLVLQKKE